MQTSVLGELLRDEHEALMEEQRRQQQELLQVRCAPRTRPTGLLHYIRLTLFQFIYLND